MSAFAAGSQRHGRGTTGARQGHIRGRTRFPALSGHTKHGNTHELLVLTLLATAS